jgi:hypothetical protein
MQQKVLLAVVILGLCALGIDRFVVGYTSDAAQDAAPRQTAAAAIGQPAKSEYTVASRASAAASSASPVAAGGSTPAPSTQASPESAWSIADRLRQVWSGLGDELPGQPRDAFAFSTAWELQQPAVSVALESGPTPADNFRRTHRLIGVVVSGDRTCAVVDGGRIIQLGQMLDGFRLIQVQHRAATFASGSQRVTLTLAERQDGALASANP